jgi:hypothetical protein
LVVASIETFADCFLLGVVKTFQLFLEINQKLLDLSIFLPSWVDLIDNQLSLFEMLFLSAQQLNCVPHEIVRVLRQTFDLQSPIHCFEIQTSECSWLKVSGVDHMELDLVLEVCILFLFVSQLALANNAFIVHLLV